MADDRKARLKALKEAAAAKEAEKPVLKFRNYSVKDEKIKHEKLDQVKVAEEEVPEVDLDHVIGEDTEEVIANVAPKKPNWDLRREIAGKLAKLERRTQRAIAELALEEEKKRMAASSKAS